MEWKDEYNTGLEEVDEQHKGLVNLITSVEKEDLTIREVIIKLLAYVDIHFDYEEKLMAECQFPRFERHKEEHSHFINKILKFEKQLINNEITLSEIYDFLMDWLLNHINTTDKDFARYYSKSNPEDID